MKNRKKPNYLAIAITQKCDCKCFYCKQSGESITNCEQTVNLDEIKKITKVAYKLGIYSFRLTGGEVSLVEFLPELIEHIMSLGSNTRIRLNTNGHNILNFLEIIEKYKERIEVIISIDSISEVLNGFYYPKHLNAKIENVAKKFVSCGIYTRANIVVTKYNACEVPELLDRLFVDLGINIKLLDLSRRKEYLGKPKKEEQLNAQDFWEDTYISLDYLKPHLEKISDGYQENFNQWITSGIPMSGYFKGNQTIQLKDSNRGANYSEFCVKHCEFFDTCQEGFFSPFVSTDLTLHVSGCLNSELRWSLNNKSEADIEIAFEDLFKLFETCSVQKN